MATDRCMDARAKETERQAHSERYLFLFCDHYGVIIDLISTDVTTRTTECSEAFLKFQDLHTYSKPTLILLLLLLFSFAFCSMGEMNTRSFWFSFNTHFMLATELTAWWVAERAPLNSIRHYAFNLHFTAHCN